MDQKRLPARKSNRLQGHDYRSPGGYFVTICSYQKKPIFGEISNEIIYPSFIGEIVRHEWFRIPFHRYYVILHEDEFVRMPNHLHAIIWIDDYHEYDETIISDNSQQKSNSLGSIVG